MSAGQSRQSSSREAFIIRLWREPPDGAAWTGQVQHVRTGEVVCVGNLRELLDYLAGRFGEADAARPEKGLR